MCWIPSQIWCIRAINGGISRVWSYLKLIMPVVFGIRENVWRDGTPTWKFSIWNGQFEDVFSVRGLKIVFLELFHRNPTCFPGSEWMRPWTKTRCPNSQVNGPLSKTTSFLDNTSPIERPEPDLHRLSLGGGSLLCFYSGYRGLLPFP